MTYKILRIALLLLMTVCFQSTVLPQKLVKCEKLKISFETNQVLEKYEESDTETGYDNDDIAIDIERKNWSELPEDYGKQAKDFAKDLTQALGFNKYKEGGKLPFIKGAYYYVATDEWQGEPFPVYVLFAISEDKSAVYEITVYCYNNDTKEGQKLVESIRFMD